MLLEALGYDDADSGFPGAGTPEELIRSDIGEAKAVTCARSGTVNRWPPARRRWSRPPTRRCRAWWSWPPGAIAATRCSPWRRGGPWKAEIEEFGTGQFDAELRALVHHLYCALGGVVRGVFQQRFASAVAALVQAKQNAHREFDSCGSHAERGSAFEVLPEGFQR
ncbi:MAG: hypothetical protein ACRDS9_14255, partial [Pseudonocardiaceae bacterium]